VGGTLIHSATHLRDQLSQVQEGSRLELAFIESSSAANQHDRAAQPSTRVPISEAPSSKVSIKAAVGASASTIPPPTERIQDTTQEKIFSHGFAALAQSLLSLPASIPYRAFGYHLPTLPALLLLGLAALFVAAFAAWTILGLAILQPPPRPKAVQQWKMASRKRQARPSRPRALPAAVLADQLESSSELELLLGCPSVAPTQQDPDVVPRLEPLEALPSTVSCPSELTDRPSTPEAVPSPASALPRVQSSESPARSSKEWDHGITVPLPPKTPQGAFTPRTPLSFIAHNTVCHNTPHNTCDSTQQPIVASPGTPTRLALESPSNSPCRVFTPELSMDELEAVLRKQERRMAVQQQSTPAKVAAMNRERRYLSNYSKQAVAGSAFNRASMDIIAATGMLQSPQQGDSTELMSPGMRSSSLVKSWLRWARLGKDYGFEMWSIALVESRAHRNAWADLHHKACLALVRKNGARAAMVFSLAGHTNGLECGLPSKDMETMRHDGQVLRTARACELAMQSDTGKLMLREATRHYELNRVLGSMTAWMNQAQVELVQRCLLYSAKSHWCQRHMLAMLTMWRGKQCRTTATIQRQNIRRLSLQSMQQRRKSSERTRAMKLERRQSWHVTMATHASSHLITDLSELSPSTVNNKANSCIPGGFDFGSTTTSPASSPLRLNYHMPCAASALASPVATVA